MKKYILLFITFFSYAALATDIERCYQKASNNLETRDCLRQELMNVRKEYSQFIQKAQNEVDELDRITGKNIGSNAFDKANLSFDKYINDQCQFTQTQLADPIAAESARLACFINHYYWRMGQLENILLK